MADKKLTELASATLPLDNDDLFYIVQQVLSTATSRSVKFSDLSAEVAQATTIAARNVIFDNIAGATFKTDQDYVETLGSAGALAQGTHFISDAGGGNINVAAGSGLVRTGNTPTAPILFFDWPASNGLAIPSNTTRYVGILYNSGSPVVAVHTTDDFTGHDGFVLGSVVNEAGTLHINHDPVEIADFFDHSLKRWYQTRPLARAERQGGLIIGNVGTRNFSITAGTLWDRLNEFPIAAVSTNVSGTFDRYYRDGGSGFTKEAAQTQWGNTQYDDGTGTLATLAGGRWANVWWYLENDGDIVMLYGRNTWASLAAAATESPPATVPARVTDAGLLVGRFIFQKSAATPGQVDSVFNVAFTLSSATDHANLSNLAWTSSGHSGTAFSLPYFVASTGVAGEIAMPNNATTFLRGDGTFASHVLLDGAEHSDTVAATPVLGDTIYANSTPAWQVLAGNTTTTRKFYREVGNGSVSAAPAWDTLTMADLPAASNTAVITAVIDGGGSVLTAGVKGDIYVPFACSLVSVTLLADVAGAAVVQIWDDVYANYPPTVGDSMSAGGTDPTISATNDHAQITSFSGWAKTTIAAGDTLRFNVVSATTITRLTVALTVTKT